MAGTFRSQHWLPGIACAGVLLLFQPGCESGGVPDSPAASADVASASDQTTAAPADSEPPLLVTPPAATPSGMVWVPGGKFVMGTNFVASPDRPNPDHIKPDEYPVHEVELDGFWMHATAITNREFAEFVAMTGFQTFSERIPTREELIQSGLDPSQIKSELFKPTSICFNRNFDRDSLVVGPQNWEYQVWHIVEGADWRHPEGPDSNIDGRQDHPVVHVNWEDAQAYCDWAGLRLPTEAEFEFAARSGGKPVKYPWGDELVVDGQEQCNYFQGTFPTNQLEKDGFLVTSPVKSFPPNDLGLYDMSGNVWEWCSDLYDATYYSRAPRRNPQGPTRSYDPAGGLEEARQVKHVQRGGSFMCNTNNCTGYRCEARMRGETLSSSFHCGFRTVLDSTMLDHYHERQAAIEAWRKSQPVEEPSPAS